MTAYVAEQGTVANPKLEDESSHGIENLQDTEEDDNGVTEIESLCMNCHDDVSNLFLPNTSISHRPYRASPSSKC